jgi:hypothetical protein
VKQFVDKKDTGEYLDLIKTHLAKHGLMLTVHVAPEKNKIKWTGTKMELVELIYALYEKECFGHVETNRKISLKTIFDVVGTVFDCEINNYHRLFWDVQNRVKDDQTKFLNGLVKTLVEKLTQLSQ